MKVGLNGMGRIGRLALRAAHQRKNNMLQAAGATAPVDLSARNSLIAANMHLSKKATVYAAYAVNKGLELNKDGMVTKAEAAYKVLQLQKQGFEVVELLNPVKPPQYIRLGGSALEKAGKLAGQYPTYYLNKLTGRFGDRMFVVARNAKAR